MSCENVVFVQVFYILLDMTHTLEIPRKQKQLKTDYYFILLIHCLNLEKEMTCDKRI